MRASLSRPGVLIATFALLVTACGGSTVTPSPAGSGTGSVPPSSVAPASVGPATVPPGGPVEIRWYCCLGTGEDPEQQPVEKKVVENFNASHPNIHLTLEIVTYDNARDTLGTELTSGNPPDVVGPVGFGGDGAFHEQWLDLAPYITKSGYDMSQYSPESVKLYNFEGQGQIGIPFALYPSELYYQPDMFEEAGLEEPPHNYGDKYKMPDGTEVDWNYDTIKQIAKTLTVDGNGKDATQAGFDPKKIVQYGFEPQMDDPRGAGAYFGAGSFQGSDGKAQIPADWAAGWKWIYDGIWTDHTIATRPVRESEAFGSGNPFSVGKVAMTTNFLWETCCLDDAGKTWDLGALPSYNGKVTGAFNADTFRILKASKHPDEAFTVLTYLLGEASADLLGIYGGMPARSADQDAFFASLDEKFTQKPDWAVAKAGVQFADNPNFEGFNPAYNETLDKALNFWSRFTGTAGLSVDTEIDKLKTDIQAIWDKAS